MEHDNLSENFIELILLKNIVINISIYDSCVLQILYYPGTCQNIPAIYDPDSPLKQHIFARMRPVLNRRGFTGLSPLSESTTAYRRGIPIARKRLAVVCVNTNA